MTNFTKNLMIAAAALTIAVGVAGAQTMKAEIPFGFRAAGAVMPAGSYLVNADQTAGGLTFFKLTNQDTHRSILAVPYTHIGQKPGETPVALTFACSGAHCTLVQAAPGSGESYRFKSPDLGKDRDTRLAVIRAVLMR